MDNPDYWIKRYTAAHKQEFGEDISPEKALDGLTRLTNVLRVILDHEADMTNREPDGEKSSGVQLPLF